jgi:hypothetical protein
MWLGVDRVTEVVVEHRYTVKLGQQHRQVVPDAVPEEEDDDAAAALGDQNLTNFDDICFNCIERNMPLAEQTPFKPEDLRAIDFCIKMYCLMAELQTGKSLAIDYLIYKALTQNMWVIVLLNMPSNAALEGLQDKFMNLSTSMGIDMSAFVINDSIFGDPVGLSREVARLRRKEKSVWFCKASDRNLRALVSALPASALKRCVVVIDEVHCLFSMDDKDAAKKSELALLELLFGSTAEGGGYHIDNLRVKSLVTLDAADADVPHLLKFFNCPPDGFVRIHSDRDKLRRRGYVGIDEFRLFDPPLDEPFTAAQRYGKDVRSLFVAQDDAAAAAADADADAGPSSLAKPRRGAARSCDGFVKNTTLDDFHPTLREFMLDAYVTKPRSFMLEATSPYRSGFQDNAVKYHAQVVARLFPDVLCLAEYGRGCVHARADGSVKTYASHKKAHTELYGTQDRPGAYFGGHKYLISNIAYGSMTYAFPGLPVTHLNLGFNKGSNNLLNKFQACGRACTYNRADLDACGGSVTVLCSRQDFDDVTKNVLRFVDEVFPQFPRHIDGVYSTDVAKKNQLSHRNNPLAEELRRESRVVVERPAAPAAIDDPPGAGPPPPPVAMDPALLAALHASRDETPLGVVFEGGVACPERVEARHQGVLVATRVVVSRRLDDAAHAAMVAAHQTRNGKPSTHPAAKEVRATQSQLDVLQGAKPQLGLLFKTHENQERRDVNDQKCNQNPAHFGKRSEGGEKTYLQVPWAYDFVNRRVVGVLRIIPRHQLRIPFVYHKIVLGAQSSLMAEARLVTAGRVPGPQGIHLGARTRH